LEKRDGGIDGIIKEDKLGLDVVYTSKAVGKSRRFKGDKNLSAAL
jgi:restriction endonuclease Mrr